MHREVRVFCTKTGMELRAKVYYEIQDTYVYFQSIHIVTPFGDLPIDLDKIEKHMTERSLLLCLETAILELEFPEMMDYWIMQKNQLNIRTLKTFAVKHP